MQKCSNCHHECKILVRIKIYLGFDTDWGNHYSEEWWCLRCITERSE